jgi:DNA-binding NarL/FixJ family response regulator
MSQWGVQMVIGKLITDESFRRRFEEQRDDCLANLCERGIYLNDSEIAALVEVNPRLWSTMATRIDRRLRQASASDCLDRRPHAPLTRREQHVLRGIFDGLTNKQIAADSGVSESAVKATLQQLFRKTHVRTRAQLVRIAIEGSFGAPQRHR